MSQDSRVSTTHESGITLTQPAQPNQVRHVIEVCDHCGSPQLQWRKCKLICTNCHQINKSCADL
jgi:hypothetical protein